MTGGYTSHSSEEYLRQLQNRQTYYVDQLASTQRRLTEVREEIRRIEADKIIREHRLTKGRVVHSNEFPKIMLRDALLAELDQRNEQRSWYEWNGQVFQRDAVMTREYLETWPLRYTDLSEEY